MDRLDIGKEKRLVPVLRFGEFDVHLNKLKLENIVVFKSGGTPSKANSSYWDGDIPWISAASMIGKYYSESKRTLTEKGLNNGSKLARKNSILILVRGSMLYNKIPVGITKRDVAFNQDLKSLIVNDNSIVDYLYQWFCAKQNLLLNKVVGTGIGAGKLDTDVLKNLKIWLPSLPEQKKIATFLSTIDKKIQQLTRKKELLVAYKKGLMQQLFSGELRFKDEKGKDYPEWEEKRLGEVATFRRGSFPQPYGLSKWYDKVNGMPFVQVFDVDSNFKLKPTTKQRISELAKPKSVFVKKGTIVLTIQGSIGRIAITQFDCYVDRTLLIFTSFTVDLDVNFFAYVVYLLFDIEKRKAPGGTIKTITKDKLKDFKILLPSLSEQIKIANALSSIDEKIENINQQITKTKTFKKGLLQQMFV